MKSEYEIRVEKLAALRKNKVNPFPSKAKRTKTIAKFLDKFDDFLAKQNNITLAGRVLSIRTQGAISFITILEESGKIQLFLKKENIGDKKFKEFTELIDRGDFISARGKAFVTKRGEKSLLVDKYDLLTKTLRPLPEKWHGLQDVETRYRKRYLDLLANTEVKNRFYVRSQVLYFIREYLHKQGYTEVETPILQPLYGGGEARPFTTHHNALDINLYLRISTELYLKRLIVGGFEKVFELSRVFRNEGVSFKHNPEFTMFETMAAYEDYTYNMKLVENVYEYCALKIFGKTELPHGDKIIDVKAPWKRLTMVDAVKDVVGWDYLSYKKGEFEKAKKDATDMGCAELEGFNKAINMGELLVVLFEEKVEKTLIQPTIVYRYPVETSPLAKQCKDDPRFVERFEHYILGQEQGNNYSELNDPIELEKRFESEEAKEKRGRAVDEFHKTDKDFVEAMSHGMPPTTGAGIGVDRMVMLFANVDSIKEVILFPTMRPKE